MILTPYIIAPHEPVKMRYMKLREAPFVTSSELKDHILTVDILPKEASLHVLLSYPDWDPKGLSRDIENICSSLLMLMDLNGLVKARNQVFWYELSLFSFPKIDLQSILFTDNGPLLSAPYYEPLSLAKSPFNISDLTNNEFKGSDSPPVETMNSNLKNTDKSQKKKRG